MRSSSASSAARTPPKSKQPFGEAAAGPQSSGAGGTRYNMPFNREWHGTHYAIKQVAPIVAENPTEFVVVTVYTFFF